jgi:hypothetical protein
MDQKPSTVKQAIERLKAMVTEPQVKREFLALVVDVLDALAYKVERMEQENSSSAFISDNDIPHRLR